MDCSLVAEKYTARSKILEVMDDPGKAMDRKEGEKATLVMQAVSWIREFFDNRVDYRIHVNEGSLFLLIRFRDLPITTRALCERLNNGVLLLFPGNTLSMVCRNRGSIRLNACGSVTPGTLKW